MIEERKTFMDRHAGKIGVAMVLVSFVALGVDWVTLLEAAGQCVKDWWDWSVVGRWLNAVLMVSAWIGMWIGFEYAARTRKRIER